MSDSPAHRDDFGAHPFDGKPIQANLIGYKRRMGYVPEKPYLYNHLSGAEYLTMVSQLRNLPKRSLQSALTRSSRNSMSPV
jgi:ABC-type multidrug transport system ATPase subunit